MEIVEKIVVDVLYDHKTKGKKEAIHNILSIYSVLIWKINLKIITIILTHRKSFYLYQQ